MQNTGSVILGLDPGHILCHASQPSPCAAGKRDGLCLIHAVPSQVVTHERPGVSTCPEVITLQYDPLSPMPLHHSALLQCDYRAATNDHPTTPTRLQPSTPHGKRRYRRFHRHHRRYHHLCHRPPLLHRSPAAPGTAAVATALRLGLGMRSLCLNCDECTGR